MSVAPFLELKEVFPASQQVISRTELNEYIIDSDKAIVKENDIRRLVQYLNDNMCILEDLRALNSHPKKWDEKKFLNFYLLDLKDSDIKEFPLHSGDTVVPVLRVVVLSKQKNRLFFLIFSLLMVFLSILIFATVAKSMGLTNYYVTPYSFSIEIVGILGGLSNAYFSMQIKSLLMIRRQFKDITRVGRMGIVIVYICATIFLMVMHIIYIVENNEGSLVAHILVSLLSWMSLVSLSV